MTVDEARNLIAACTFSSRSPQLWADLGCGSGTFSYALATLLPPGSRIVCVDQSRQRIQPEYNKVSLEFVQADLERVSFASASLSGVIMANALHYVEGQQAFVERMKPFLSKDARWLFVEYDSDEANPWVPYPLSFASLMNLFNGAGYQGVTKLGEKVSVYGRANLYACEIRT